jgi:hypothetical protein
VIHGRISANVLNTRFTDLQDPEQIRYIMTRRDGNRSWEDIMRGFKIQWPLEDICITRLQYIHYKYQAKSVFDQPFRVQDNLLMF